MQFDSENKMKRKYTIVFALVLLCLFVINRSARSQQNDSRARDSILSFPVEEREHLQKNPYVYERYNTPSQCYYAAFRGLARYRRNLRMDTVVLVRSRDTLPDEVEQVARACMSKFDMNTVPARFLIGAYSANIYANQYDDAKQAVNRFVAEYPENDSSQIRRKALALARAGKTDRWFNRHVIKDMIERGQLIEKLGQWRYAPEAYSSIFEIAKENIDPDMGIDGTKRYVNAWSKWTNEEVNDWGGAGFAFDRWLEFDSWKNGVEGNLHIIRTNFVPLLHARQGGGEDQRKQIDKSLTDLVARNNQYIGDPASPILARYWFDSTGVPEQRLPRQGRTTIVFISDPELGGNDYYRFNLMRRLHEKYHQRGLDILVVTRLKGHFRYAITESKEEELELLRQYYLDHLKLPITLAIDDVRYSKRFDGMRIAEEVPWRRTWLMLSGTDGVVVGSDGKFFSIEINFRWWDRAFQVVEQALEKAGN